MTKLIIQIRCSNEGKTQPITQANLPCELERVSQVKWLIIGDGSSDLTVQVTKENEGY